MSKTNTKILLDKLGSFEDKPNYLHSLCAGFLKLAMDVDDKHEDSIQKTNAIRQILEARDHSIIKLEQNSRMYRQSTNTELL